MPISNKIIDRINKLNADTELKKVMYKILEAEDRGIHWYKDEYEKYVKEYLKQEKEREA